jgi:hypothetical protein
MQPRNSKRSQLPGQQYSITTTWRSRLAESSHFHLLLLLLLAQMATATGQWRGIIAVFQMFQVDPRSVFFFFFFYKKRKLAP